MAYKIEAIVETEEQKEKLEEVIRGYLTPKPKVEELKEEEPEPKKTRGRPKKK